MHRERLSEDIFVFTSSLYAQVTAGIILTPEGAIVIDTLPFPSETRQIAEFAAQRSPLGVRYVILTHYHADHVYGAYQFPQAEVIGHARCRELLVERGQAGLKSAQAHTLELSEVSLRLPDVIFADGDMTLRLGDKTLQLIHTPGHSADAIVVLVKEDRILFASDTIIPVPYIVDGDLNAMLESLRRVQAMNLEIVVQGHGEMILRGEIEGALKSNIKYLKTIQALIKEKIQAGKGRDSVNVPIEDCGKSRILLNGLVERLHMENLLSLYDREKNQVTACARHINLNSRR
jgi:glyoxylase-like metal-dependent hydrolase (beta-lactamase superfamily II)